MSRAEPDIQSHATIRRLQAQRGFSLLEVIIAIGLFVVLMSSMYMFYNNMLRFRDQGTQISRDGQLARVILERMANEVRQAVGQIQTYGPGILGEKEWLEINTLTVPDRVLSERRDPRLQPLPGQFDLKNVRYFIAWDEENLDEDGHRRPLGLVRRVSRTYLRGLIIEKDEAEVSEDQATVDEAELAFWEALYAPEIKFFEVLYFDGATWWPTWQLVEGNTLPQLVRITVGFQPDPDELELRDEMEIVDEDFLQNDEETEPLARDRYSIVVRLKQADVFFGSRLTREASAFGESAGAL